MNYCYIAHSADNTNFNSLGKKEMYKDYPGGLGYIWNVDINTRYVSIVCSDPTGYYYGLGELEVYEHSKTSLVPKLVADFNGQKTEAKVSWSVDGATEVVVRRTVVTVRNSFFFL